MEKLKEVLAARVVDELLAAPLVPEPDISTKVRLLPGNPAAADCVTVMSPKLLAVNGTNGPRMAVVNPICVVAANVVVGAETELKRLISVVVLDESFVFVANNFQDEEIYDQASKAELPSTE